MTKKTKTKARVYSPIQHARDHVHILRYLKTATKAERDALLLKGWRIEAVAADHA